MKHNYPSFDEFVKLSAEGNTIPVYRLLLADSLTPVTAYRRLAAPAGIARSRHSFLLESVVGGERIARFSFVGADPEATFCARRNEMTVSRGGGSETTDSDDPLAELKKMVDGYRAVHLPDLPRFTGGVVGDAPNHKVRD